jgi:quercetin dioxygenase-like cupin family protein
MSKPIHRRGGIGLENARGNGAHRIASIVNGSGSMTTSANMTVRKPEQSEIAAMIDPDSVAHIISSKSYLDGDWRNAARIGGAPAGVSKQLVPIDMASFTAQVITSVEPRTRVARHAHDGAVLRYGASGSFRLNDVDYSTGDWILVPAGVEYEIETKEGYTVVASYKSCSHCGEH